MPQALPLVFAVAGSAVASSAAVVGAVGTIGAGLLGAAVSIGGGLLAQSLVSTPKPQAAEAQSQARIGGVAAAPPYRYVYGRTRIGGYRVFTHVEGDILFVAYLLNARPSHEITDIEFDGRPVLWLSGADDDIHDMAKGAGVSSAPFAGLVRIWVGMGDQTSPPTSIFSEINDHETLAATDAWRGLTVLWLRLDYGDARTAGDRWIGAPPDLRVTGRWSKVYDPRFPAQDPNDPATWTYKDNAALCALDLVRDRRGMNRIDDLIDLQSFFDGANVCDQQVALKAGGSERRYRVGGVVEMGAQESAKVAGALDAAAAVLVDISGRLTYLPGVWRAPQLTLDDVVGSQMDYSDLRQGREAPNTIRTAILAEARGWQETEIAPLQDPVALAEDQGIVREARLDLPLVSSPTQAMRLQKIALRRARHERRITAEFPASAYAAHAADTVTVALAGFPAADGAYEVESFEPRLTETEGGVAMTVALSLVETSEDVYAWTPAADEADFADSAGVDNTPVALAPPGAITVASGARAVGDGSQAPQAVLTFAPSASGAVVAYQVQRRPNAGVFLDAGVVSRDQVDGNNDIYVEVEGVSFGDSYDFRVYAVSRDGRRSAPSISLGNTIAAPASTIAAPLGGTAVSDDPGVVAVTFTTAPDSDMRAIRFYGADSNSTAAATTLTTIPAAPNQTIAITDSGLTSGAERYYWARSVDPYGGLSGYSAVVSVTVA